jgi:hypothetical protein
MRILAKLFDAHQHAAMASGCAELGATVAAPTPDVCNARR